ncbi:hypothetical protein GCM10010149_87880 [Nonomuraea roseoviolacea subsp. roseoviolacea]|uniref:hypothetical protein n=1 Tax=Nonomuraea roseoviolacea TaxID=103837 RepID=UPI0031D73D9D
MKYEIPSYIEIPSADAPAAERVAAGAALLDKNLPGWAARIDTETFSLASLYKCILGQLFGFYDTGMRAIGWSWDDDVMAQRFGFHMGNCDDTWAAWERCRDGRAPGQDCGCGRYDEGQQAWLREIASRNHPAAVADDDHDTHLVRL